MILSIIMNANPVRFYNPYAKLALSL